MWRIHPCPFRCTTVIKYLKAGPLKTVLLHLKPYKSNLHDIPTPSTISDNFRCQFETDQHRTLLATIGPSLVQIEDDVFNNLGIGWMLELMKQHYLEDRDGSMFGHKYSVGDVSSQEPLDSTGEKLGASGYRPCLGEMYLSALPTNTHISTS